VTNRNRSFFLLVAASLFALVLAGMPATAGETFTGKVAAVSDGDTLVIKRGGFDTIVQIAGIDAPELSQDYGKDAAKELRHMAQGKKATVTIVEEADKRHVVGHVSVGGQDVATALVKSGHAWTSPEGGNELQTAQHQAKSAKEGIWAANDPTPPWTYRESHSR